MGRRGRSGPMPRRPEERRTGHVISLLTRDELVALQARCADANLTVSSYVRGLVRADLGLDPLFTNS